MRWILRLFGQVLILNVALLAIIGSLRLLPIPADLQTHGIAQCDGKPCFTRPVNQVDLSQRPLTVGWIVAWLGTPCAATSNSATVILRYPNAEIYAATFRTWNVGTLSASARLWGVQLSNTAPVACQEGSRWRGFSTFESLTAGADLKRR